MISLEIEDRVSWLNLRLERKKADFRFGDCVPESVAEKYRVYKILITWDYHPFARELDSQDYFCSYFGAHTRGQLVFISRIDE